MSALTRVAADLRALAEDLRAGDPESEAAHRVWVAAQQIDAQVEMQDRGLVDRGSE